MNVKKGHFKDFSNEELASFILSLSGHKMNTVKLAQEANREVLIRFLEKYGKEITDGKCD